MIIQKQHKKSILAATIMSVILVGCGSDDNKDTNLTPMTDAEMPNTDLNGSMRPFTDLGKWALPTEIQPTLPPLTEINPPQMGINDAMQPVVVIPSLAQNAVADSSASLYDSKNNSSAYLEEYGLYLFEGVPSYPIRAENANIFDIRTTISSFEGRVASPITHFLRYTDEDRREEMIANLTAMTGVERELLLGNYESTEVSKEVSLNARKLAASLLVYQVAGSTTELLNLVLEAETHGEWFTFVNDHLSERVADRAIEQSVRNEYHLMQDAIQIIAAYDGEPEYVLASIEDYIYLIQQHHALDVAMEEFALSTNYGSDPELLYQVARSLRYKRVFYRHYDLKEKETQIDEDGNEIEVDVQRWDFIDSVKSRIDTEKEKLTTEMVSYIYRNNEDWLLMKQLYPELSDDQLAQLILDLYANEANATLKTEMALKQSLTQKLSRLTKSLTGDTDRMLTFLSYEFNIVYPTTEQDEMFAEYLANIVEPSQLTFDSLYAEALRIYHVYDADYDRTLDITFVDPIITSGEEYHPVFNPDGLKAGTELGVFTIENATDISQFEVSIIRTNDIAVEPTGNPFEYRIILLKDADYESVATYSYELYLKQTRLNEVTTRYYPFTLTLEDILEVEVKKAVWDANSDSLHLDFDGDFSNIASMTINGVAVTPSAIIDTSAIDLTPVFYIDGDNPTNELNKPNSIVYQIDGGPTLTLFAETIEFNGFSYGLMNGNGNVWFDRNLGANNRCDVMLSDCQGMHYQWGRSTGDGHGRTYNNLGQNVSVSIANTFKPDNDVWYQDNVQWTLADHKARLDEIKTGLVHDICPKYFNLPLSRDVTRDFAKSASANFPPAKGVLSESQSVIWKSQSGIWAAELDASGKPFEYLVTNWQTPQALNSARGMQIRCQATF